jgi:hypothetical protein
MEPEFPAHGIRSLDDALKEFERLAAEAREHEAGKQHVKRGRLARRNVFRSEYFTFAIL